MTNNMKIENCETEADFFGWFLNKCRTEGWNPSTDAPLKEDHHWKDAMECNVPRKYAEQVQYAIAYHVYEAWIKRSSKGLNDTVIVGTYGYYDNIPDGYAV